MKDGKQALIVDTLHKGVFFGFGIPTHEQTIELTDARMVVYWDTSQQGNVGLASSTNLSKCRISPPCPSIILQDVTAIMSVTPESEREWLKPHWTK